jgi:hypothetical protein
MNAAVNGIKAWHLRDSILQADLLKHADALAISKYRVLYPFLLLGSGVAQRLKSSK